MRHLAIVAAVALSGSPAAASIVSYNFHNSFAELTIDQTYLPAYLPNSSMDLAFYYYGETLASVTFRADDLAFRYDEHVSRPLPFDSRAIVSGRFNGFCTGECYMRLTFDEVGDVAQFFIHLWGGGCWQNLTNTQSVWGCDSRFTEASTTTVPGNFFAERTGEVFGNAMSYSAARVAIAPVPLPFGAWLLLSAIGGLGFMRWRQT